MGNELMSQLDRYSGNLTDVEHGRELAQLFDARDYARLYVKMDVPGGSGKIPSLWVFLLIILGCLCGVILMTSVLMNFVQRQHRRQLRRRVANGEVNLEALGIKRLTVPEAIINKLPLHEWKGEMTQPTVEPAIPAPAIVRSKGLLPDETINEEDTTNPSITLPRRNSDPAPTRAISPPLPPLPSELNTITPSKPKPHQTYLNPTCAICLDDFIPNDDTIRELPCGHIFHPQCIDPFLKDISSLCPLCKKSVLPAGYCPPNLSNAMVRRERLVRRIRERIDVPESELPPALNMNEIPPSLVGSHRMASFHRQFGRVRTSRRISSAPIRGSMLEMQTPEEGAADELDTGQQAAGTPVDSETRAENRRQRAMSRVNGFIGRMRTVEDEEAEREERLPSCKSWKHHLSLFLHGFGDPAGHYGS